jgi:hypothetical protein
VHAEEHQQAARHLDGVADEHDLALGPRVGKRTDEGREHHVEQGKERHQRGALPLGRAACAQQFDRSHEQRVVRQRTEELRRHDGVEAALHGDDFVSRCASAEGG